jgi:hypothetical protein
VEIFSPLLLASGGHARVLGHFIEETWAVLFRVFEGIQASFPDGKDVVEMVTVMTKIFHHFRNDQPFKGTFGISGWPIGDRQRLEAGMDLCTGHPSVACAQDVQDDGMTRCQSYCVYVIGISHRFLLCGVFL